MSPDILMKGVVASYFVFPQRMEMSHNCISSPSGIVLIRPMNKTSINYPKGQ